MQSGYLSGLCSQATFETTGGAGAQPWVKQLSFCCRFSQCTRSGRLPLWMPQGSYPLLSIPAKWTLIAKIIGLFLCVCVCDARLLFNCTPVQFIIRFKVDLTPSQKPMFFSRDKTDTCMSYSYEHIHLLLLSAWLVVIDLNYTPAYFCLPYWMVRFLWMTADSLASTRGRSDL